MEGFAEVAEELAPVMKTGAIVAMILASLIIVSVLVIIVIGFVKFHREDK